MNPGNHNTWLSRPPHNRCVSFAVIVADRLATLATRQLLNPVWTPSLTVRSRQLLWRTDIDSYF